MNESATPGAPAALLRVEDLHVHLRSPHGVVRAVDGVTFELGRGESLGIVGESGSGKSVMARAIANLHTGASVARLSGKVVFADSDILGASTRRMRAIWGRHIALVFQDPSSALNPVMRVGRQISEAIREHEPMSRRAATARVLDLLDDVRLPDPRARIGLYPHEMSGGMRQRVAIAIALAAQPDLLIADEPTTALDVTVQAQILDLLATIQQRRNMALILISHDLAVVAGRTDRTAVMYAGQIVEEGSSERVLTRPSMPYTHALLRAVPSADNPVHSRLAQIPGAPPDLTVDVRGCRFAPRCTRADDHCATTRPALLGGEMNSTRYRCWHPLAEANEGASGE